MAEKFRDKEAFFRAFGAGNGVHHFVFSDIHGESTTSIDGRHLAESMWDRLVKAGLAEEQREPGDYHVKWHPKTKGEPARFNYSGTWDGFGVTTVLPPAVIGPRIEPPKD